MKNAVIVDGSRIPFCRAQSDYKNLMSYELGSMALKGLLNKSQIDLNCIDSVIMGTVISDYLTSNVAREVLLSLGLPKTVPGYTVSIGCISANQAITNAVDQIVTGKASCIIAGGTDTVSDFPIRYKKSMRQKFMMLQKAKSPWQLLNIIKTLRPSHFAPENPAVLEFSVGYSMGKGCERMASRFKVSRQEQDEFSKLSHDNAAKGYEEGVITNEVYPVSFQPKFKTISKDNGIRENLDIKKLEKLRPAFDRKFGTLTAGNSTFLTDGAAFTLVMEEEKAKEMGFQPLARVVDYNYTAGCPLEEMLLGPAYGISKLMNKNNLKQEDIGVFEIHEAFAGQILSVLKCLDSDSFTKENLGFDSKVGQIPMEKLNKWGGSLALGHPFGATGARLVTTTANRLVREDKKYGLLSACALGGHSNTILLEKC
jgi:acetyl-CoA acetyltransferase family protein